VDDCVRDINDSIELADNRVGGCWIKIVIKMSWLSGCGLVRCSHRESMQCSPQNI